MTKGANFQARIDLTNQRREAAKALKAAKAAGLVIEPDALMTKILLLDPDVDVYLLAEPQSGTGAAREASMEHRPLCTAHFQREACSNRRCKWSHALTLGNARPATAVLSGRGSGGGGGGGGASKASGEASYTMEGAEESTMEPPLVAMPGFGPRPTDRRRAIGAPRPGSGGGFDIIPEGFIDELARWLSSDADIGRWSRSCRVVRLGLLSSLHVASRRTAALPRLTADRNRWLVRKANAARVKYVVSFAAANAAAHAAALTARTNAVAENSENYNAPNQSPRSGSRTKGGKGSGGDGSDLDGTGSSTMESSARDAGSGDGGGGGETSPLAAATTAATGKDSRRSSRRDKKASKAQAGKGALTPSSPDASRSTAAAAATVGPVLAHDWRQLEVFRAFERSHRPLTTSSPTSPSQTHSSTAAKTVAAPRTPAGAGRGGGAPAGAAAENDGNDADGLANELDNLSFRNLDQGSGDGASGSGGGLISRSSSGASEVGSASSGSSSSSSSYGARACSACTFLHSSEAEADLCEMCSTPLPPLSLPSARTQEVLRTANSSTSASASGSGSGSSSTTGGSHKGVGKGRVQSVGWSLLELPPAALQRVVALSADVTAANVASLSTRHRAAAKVDDAFRRRKAEGGERQKKAKKAKKTSRLAKADKIGRNKMKKGK